MACEETEGCMAMSLSVGGRCAMWMVEMPMFEHPVFGQAHVGENWKEGMMLTTTSDDDRWQCVVRYCEGGDDCGESMMMMMEMESRMEMMAQNAEFLGRMFEQCLVRDLEVSECMDEPHWYDNQGRDCAYYKATDMCDYNYLHIFADENGHDARTACCACGGGDPEYARRRLAFGETCEGMSVEAEADCLRNRVSLLETTINNVGL